MKLKKCKTKVERAYFLRVPSEELAEKVAQLENDGWEVDMEQNDDGDTDGFKEPTWNLWCEGEVCDCSGRRSRSS